MLLISVMLSLFCLSTKQAEYPHLSGRWTGGRWMQPYFFSSLFSCCFSYLSLSFSYVRGIMMSTKGGFPTWNHIVHILVSYLLITRKTPGFSALTHRAKNLYNVASFYIRNAYSASIKSNEDRFPHYRSWKNSMVSLMNWMSYVKSIIAHQSTSLIMNIALFPCSIWMVFLNCVTRSITVLFLHRQIRMFCICCIVTGKAFLLL